MSSDGVTRRSAEEIVSDARVREVVPTRVGGDLDDLAGAEEPLHSNLLSCRRRRVVSAHDPFRLDTAFRPGYPNAQALPWQREAQRICH